MTTLPYCDLCGNEKTRAKDRVGPACRKLINGTPGLKRAYQKWVQYGTEHTRCCGGLSHDKTHFYFHAKHAETSYPLNKKTGRPLKRGQSVSVEMGVSFYPKQAYTYYLRDFDSFCDSEMYGPPIPYSLPDTDFWNKVDQQLGEAAEYAWNDDLLSCGKCGYHFHGIYGTCKCFDCEGPYSL